MDDAKALLDSLMGPSRDKGKKDQKNDDFMEKNVCKNYLVCWCPADWFTNTRREQKPCHKLHSEHLKGQFEAHPDYKKLKLRYEKEFLRHLEMMCAEADNWVTREKRKSRPAGKEIKIPIELRPQYEQLEKEYAELLAEAEKTASEKAMQQADSKKEQIDTLKKMHTVDFGGEEVCEVCGVRYPLLLPDPSQGPSGLSKDKIAEFEHAQGKVHIGYKRIRDKLEEVKSRIRQEENAMEPDNEPKRGGDRSRSRGRRGDRDKRNGEKDGDEKAKKDSDETDKKKEDGKKDDDRRNDRGRDDRRGRRDSPRDRRGDDRGRRRRDDSRDRGRRRR